MPESSATGSGGSTATGGTIATDGSDERQHGRKRYDCEGHRLDRCGVIGRRTDLPTSLLLERSLGMPSFQRATPWV